MKKPQRTITELEIQRITEECLEYGKKFNWFATKEEAKEVVEHSVNILGFVIVKDPI